MKFLQSLFKAKPQRSYDEIIHEADVDDTYHLALCELNLVGQRNGPREISSVITLKDNSLLIVPFDKSIPLFSIAAAALSMVKPRSDELRIKTANSTPVTAEYFKIDRPSYAPANPAVTRWNKELALQFFEELLKHGAIEIDQQQLSGQ